MWLILCAQLVTLYVLLQICVSSYGKHIVVAALEVANVAIVSR